MKLDLGVLKQETLDITLINGNVLNIKKPCKRLLVEINKTDMELVGESDFEKIINKIEDITIKILSNNTDKLPFTVKMIEENEIDYTLQLHIFKAYMSFISNLANNPN